MATPLDQLDQLIATTYDKYRKKLADNVSTHVVLYAWLKDRARVSERGGLTIRVPLLTDTNDTIGSYSDYDLLDVTPQEGIHFAEYQWRQFAGAVTISGTEVMKNAGPEQIIGLLDAKFEQLRMSFELQISDWMWAASPGNGGKDPLGIPAVVDDASTLGGIDPADAATAYWKSVVDSTAYTIGATSGIKPITSMYNTLTVSGSRPDLEITTQSLFEAFEDAAVEKIRYTDTRLAKLDFEGLAHRKAEVTFESRVPSGDWFFLNSNRLQFITHADAWMSRTEFMRPIDQDAKTAQVLSACQLITNERRAHGRLTAVTADA